MLYLVQEYEEVFAHEELQRTAVVELRMCVVCACMDGVLVHMAATRQ